VYSNGILNRHSTYKAKAPGVITGRSGTIGKVTFIEEDYFPHNTTLWVTDFKGNNPKFIYYLYLFLKLERFSTGSGVPTLNRNDVHANSISIPPTSREQKAIAQILSDMDAEIEKLEQQREKYKAVKQGMMQELLTGKTRLT
jgi:type I restriction enzyme S subunit